MHAPGVHLVQIDRDVRSDTLPAHALERLTTAWRSKPWWRTGWDHPAFRLEALRVAQECGGIVLDGTRGRVKMPPPFSEFFEPIELEGAGSSTRRLKMLSGEKSTSEERAFTILVALIAVGFLFAAAAGLLAVMHGMLNALVAPTIFMILLILALVFGIQWIRTLGGRWFIVPGGIAMFRRPPRRGAPRRITVLSRANATPALRYVSTGKATVLMLELWTGPKRGPRRAVSVREAMSVLAAWRSPLKPPDDSQLEELLS